MNLMGFSRLFRMNEEQNFPSYFSALALLACSIAAALLRGAARDSAESRGWAIAAFILLFLSVDEAASVHELMNGLRFGEQGVLYYGWVVPYGLAFVVLSLCLLPFWWSLAPRMKWTLAGGAALYVAGALGMELVEASLVARSGMEAYNSHAMRVSLLIEEGSEMLGIAIVLYALLAGVEDAMGGRLIVQFAGTMARRRSPVPRSLGGKRPIDIVPQRGGPMPNGASLDDARSGAATGTVPRVEGPAPDRPEGGTSRR